MKILAIFLIFLALVASVRIDLHVQRPQVDPQVREQVREATENLKRYTLEKAVEEFVPTPPSPPLPNSASEMDSMFA